MAGINNLRSQFNVGTLKTNFTENSKGSTGASGEKQGIYSPDDRAKIVKLRGKNLDKVLKDFEQNYSRDAILIVYDKKNNEILIYEIDKNDKAVLQRRCDYE